MGQAKRRGSYALRKMQAIERDRLAREADAQKRAEIAHTRPGRSRNPRIPLAIAVAIAASLSR
jgi:hypothetical protein